MKLFLRLAFCLAAASVPGAVLAQGGHSEHQHGTATSAAASMPQAAARQAPEAPMGAMAMAGHGKDCHCCCCEAMQGMMGQHGPAPNPGAADHEHQPPTK